MSAPNTPRSSFNRVKDELEKMSLEEELKKHHIDLIDRVVVEENGERFGTHVVARTPYGNVFYIDVSRSGSSFRFDNNSIYQIKEFSVPDDLKKETTSIVGVNVRGVALACRDGICFMTQDENGTPNEQKLARYDQIESQTPENFGSYPVVDIEDVRHHSAEVIRSIDEICARLEQEALSKTFKTMLENQKMLKEQYELATKNVTMFKSIFERLKREGFELRGKIDMALKNPQVLEKRQSIFSQLCYNAQKRIQVKQDMGARYSNVHKTHQRLEKTHQDLQLLHQFLQNADKRSCGILKQTED